MALPTKTKTWNQSVITVANTLAAGTMHRDIMFAIKDMLVTNMGWTVTSSSDGVSAGASDFWLDSGDLIWATGASAKSWCLLTNTGTNVQLLLHCNGSSAQQWNAGIATTTGTAFTGGTTTAAPTSPDQVNFVNVATAWLVNNVAPTNDTKVHGWSASDGKVHHIAVTYNTKLVLHFMVFEAENPRTNHAYPWFITWLKKGSVNDLVYSDYNNIIYSIHSGTNYTSYLTGEGIANSGLHIVTGIGTSAEDLDGEYPLYPVGVASSIPGFRGPKGTIPDLYWGNYQVVGIGDTYPNDATRLWVQLGALVLPNDGSVFTLS